MLHRSRLPFLSLLLSVPLLPPAGLVINFNAREAIQDARNAGSTPSPTKGEIIK
jgi:hypothetical protein